MPRGYPEVYDEMIVDDSVALPAQKAIILTFSSVEYAIEWNAIKTKCSL